MVGQLRQQNSQAKNLGRILKAKTPFQTKKRKKKPERNDEYIKTSKYKKKNITLLKMLKIFLD